MGPTRGGRFWFSEREYAYISFGLEVSAPTSVLSDAEAEVARLAAAGQSNNDIARIRRVSVRTVANQLVSIYRKLDIVSRIELIAWLCADRHASPSSRRTRSPAPCSRSGRSR